MHVARRKPLIIPAAAMMKRPAEADHILVNLMKLGIFPSIEGGAKGTNQLGDVVTTTADGRSLNAIWAEYQRALQLYNSERDRLMGLLSFDVTNPIEDVFQGGDTVDFEKASEFGLPKTVRITPPTYFSLGYTFDWYDVGTQYTWQFLAEAVQTQLDSLQNAILEADNRLVFTEVMKSIFNNLGRAATIEGTNFNVYPFYNADATVPPRYKNTIHTAPHTHYLVSGAAAFESNDLDDMETHLKHHGYGWETGTALIALMPTAQVNIARNFRVASLDTYDFIPSQGAPAWAIPTDLMIQPGATPPASFQGQAIAGRYGPWLIVEEDMIPAGYVLGVGSGGENSAANPVGLREHARAQLRGLRLVKGADPDYPLIDSYYQRGFGTGIRQRGAGVVLQVKAAGGYDIPAAYV